MDGENVFSNESQLENGESQNIETQKLNDATNEPRSFVEQNGDYKQAEAVQDSLTNLVDASAESAASGTAGEEVEATPITIPDELPESSGESIKASSEEVEATPITIPDEHPEATRESIKTGSEEVKATPITVPDELQEQQIGQVDANAVEEVGWQAEGNRVKSAAQEGQDVTVQEQESRADPEQPLREAEFEKPILREDLGQEDPGGKGVGGRDGFPGARGDDSRNLKPSGMKDDLFEDPMEGPDPTLGKDDFKIGLDEDLIGGDPSGGKMDVDNSFGLQDDMFSSKGQSDGSPNPLVAGNVPGHISGELYGGKKKSPTKKKSKVTFAAAGSDGHGKQTFKITGTSKQSCEGTAINLFQVARQESDKGTRGNGIIECGDGTWWDVSWDENGVSAGKIYKDTDADIDGGVNPGDIAHADHVNDSYDQSHISNITPDQASAVEDASMAPKYAKKFKDILEKQKDANGSKNAGPKVNPGEVTDPPNPKGEAGKQTEGGSKL